MTCEREVKTPVCTKRGIHLPLALEVFLHSLATTLVLRILGVQSANNTDDRPRIRENKYLLVRVAPRVAMYVYATKRWAEPVPLLS